MSQREDLLLSKESFRSVEMYPDELNNVQLFPDCIIDGSKELIAHADGLRSAPNSDVYHSNSQPLDDSETVWLRVLALKRRSKRFTFINYQME